MTSYINKVLSYNPMAYWPCNEVSGSVAHCLINPLQNGTYFDTAVGTEVSPDGSPAPVFNGTSSYLGISSNTLQNAFPIHEGSFCGWVRSDELANVYREGYAYTFYQDGTNKTYFEKVLANRIRWVYEANDVLTVPTYIGWNNAFVWFHTGLVWSVSGDYVKAYLNGVQYGTTKTGIGTWVADPAPWSNGFCMIGGKSAGFDLWKGPVSHVAVFDSLLSPTDFQDLATASVDPIPTPEDSEVVIFIGGPKWHRTRA